MIAIQGPNAVEITKKLTSDDIGSLPYYWWGEATIAGIPCAIARTGYTGEDGFEFYPPIERIWPRSGTRWLLPVPICGVQPIGLGARDTLRLEARMPLYGQELGETISPYEAGTGWAVKLDKGDFIGRDAMAGSRPTDQNARPLASAWSGDPVPHARIIPVESTETLSAKSPAVHSRQHWAKISDWR